ncbi:MAG TPA: hypothetical protein PK280_17015, partial [Planctomycetota bacterium]|nr:hypothetical protein [Planctomycetota bacterium]
MPEENAPVRPKWGFYVVLLMVVAGLLVYGFRNQLFPKGKDETTSGGRITPDDLKGGGKGAEAADSNIPTTVKEYKFVPSEKLPPVQGTSSYEPLQGRTVKFSLNVWAGWAPIILQNEGKGPGKLWKTPGGQDFKVELVLIDDPVAMRDAYAAGKVHVGWATLDMIPLFMEGLQKDSRVWPRVYQQVDWS